MSKSSYKKLYEKAFPSKRSGNLYNAFSYPTKISPEVIAVFIASHTEPGDIVVDTFGGSGTTGLAAHLCSAPTPEVLEIAKEMDAPVKWGPRKAVLYELSSLGAFIAKTMCTPPNPEQFLFEAINLLKRVESKFGWMYTLEDPNGKEGFLRHAIWSEMLKCNNCGHESSYWDSAICLNPLTMSDKFLCENCNYSANINEINRVTEEYFDQILEKKIVRKKRILTRVYGQTGKVKWVREPLESDNLKLVDIEENIIDSKFPIEEIKWGDLYRSGYHFGITHAHHFYTKRNYQMLSELMNEVNNAPKEMQSALRLLILSYNSSHSTLMTRVVVKKNQKDFVLTGAQSGVLYVSNIPVEKNILVGLKRKINTFYKAFQTIEKSTSSVEVINQSSTSMKEIGSNTVKYIFTDPPFGDYIPYSELNYLNELWLNQTTQTEKEIIINSSQKKGIAEYQYLMFKVFQEISRILQDDGKATVVFHSAKSEVWKALQNAYRSAGLNVVTSSVLDKLQGSFKQVSSNITVKGDPLLLLEQGENTLNIGTAMDEISIETIISKLLLEIRMRDEIFTPERLFSRFINFCLERNLEVPLDANRFYNILKSHLNSQESVQ
ncbi:DNA methyltransferase [Paenibacillus xylanexedens]|uniref:DNA methyltransferase n=1 Tax=Paenibacillus xylanexedens TaxID=528191 RepID=UPI0011A73DD1|nr:DNA methyltransferase [Paenibacillus xylanexedens]